MAVVPPVAGVLIGGAAGYLVRRVAQPRLLRWAARTTTDLDDVLIDGVTGALPLWGALLGLRTGLGMAPLSAPVEGAAGHVVVMLFGLSVTWTLARLAGTFVATLGGAEAPLASARILRTIAQTGVFAFGALVTLSSIGVSVAPLLTALGVGGLAVGLALQDTLANLFAGVHILASRQVRPGDFVRLSTGEEGYVADISWRNTTVRQLSNNIVIVPNAQLAKSVTLNFSLPEPEQAVLVPLGIGYDEDLEVVEREVVGVARDVQRTVEGAVASFEPFIRYHTFGESSIDCTVILRGRTFTDNYLMKHEFVKRLHARFGDAGITIPYPQRTLHWSAGDAARVPLRTPGPSAPTAGSPS